MYCNEDAKTHVLSVRCLEPEDSEFMTESHLVKGTTLLWKTAGQKYTTMLLEVYGKYLLCYSGFFRKFIRFCIPDHSCVVQLITQQITL